PARSMPTRAGGQSLSTGKSMERDTDGREAARPAPTPIREDQTPLGRCCASSSNTRSPRSRREGRQGAPRWALLNVGSWPSLSKQQLRFNLRLIVQNDVPHGTVAL